VFNVGSVEVGLDVGDVLLGCIYSLHASHGCHVGATFQSLLWVGGGDVDHSITLLMGLALVGAKAYQTLI
jgi:hypothetical protein